MSKIKDLTSKVLSKIVVKPISWRCCNCRFTNSTHKEPCQYQIMDGWHCHHKKCDRCQVNFENSGQVMAQKMFA
ncbi:hypothetical protein DL98DRAFT_595772 [Cadophora sp. DSE1049]|nr:hypothetical protein DL98DRAFT_595772 [Cadophora sp. DSE1049]